MADPLEALAGRKTILLTTFRRDGTRAASPVSLAFDGDRAFFRTWDTSWKAKRLRRNPDVEVAPATFRGTPTGPTIRARARRLSGADERLARRALARRHPVLHRFLVPLAHRLMRRRTVHFELLPRPDTPRHSA
jgi:PPOX class probable F420-dependent enzyme